MTIKLIAGLGNPGIDYDHTRHNAGAWVVETLAQQANTELRQEKKFHGQCARININGHDIWLLLPTTFMNHSGQALQALAAFYKIDANDILVCHDELDLAPGDIRLKSGGGHGGHNGLRDIISHLGTNKFHRLRVGINHPGHKDKVLNYVLGRPSRSDQEHIIDAIARATALMPTIIKGDMNKAMTQLHTK